MWILPDEGVLFLLYKNFYMPRNTCFVCLRGHSNGNVCHSVHCSFYLWGTSKIVLQSGASYFYTGTEDLQLLDLMQVKVKVITDDDICGCLFQLKWLLYKDYHIFWTSSFAYWLLHYWVYCYTETCCNKFTALLQRCSFNINSNFYHLWNTT
jgi:hypothetical protein